MEAIALPRVFRTLTRCVVCGFSEVHTDEVVDHGTVLLAECPRCDHRWTEALAPAPALTAARPRRLPNLRAA